MTAKLRLYNTLTRTLEEFAPMSPPAVTMYVCGPTVYDDPHIGHARSAFVFDVLRRYLAYRGFQVRFVRNVTDVDDKIIEKARHQTSDNRQQVGDLQAACREVSERYLKSYHGALERLGIGAPTLEPRATQEIDAMLDLISELVIKGSAYDAKGDVYFSVRKFPGYGRLSNRTLDELRVGARVEPGDLPDQLQTQVGAGKQDPLDFALWKTAKPGEPSWKSPWGEGRPGWHIECSAMSTKHLGPAFDIHGGGVDLVFPHHENEIAQAQAADRPFAKYWVHNGLLTVNGEKMSKSLGNFIPIDQALVSCGSVDALKLFFLSSHYRSPVDYTEVNITAAHRRLEGINGFLQRAAATGASAKRMDEWVERFTRAMDQDLNTPEALAVIDKMIAQGYETAATVMELCTLLGLSGHGPSTVQVTPEITELVRQRESARKSRDFTTADRLRKDVEAKGFTIEDTPNGPLVLPKP